ncbi:MAG TPA: primosome assembly protein PriA, partial [Mycobacteriales bacterium]|nr:primosome assembly protein PriA [Mycobacteriales bacterium]
MELPVARVAVDVPVSHLDRVFDYAVPEVLDEVARPGVRVRVRFRDRLVDGYLLERTESSEFRLQPLKVVSPEPVLAPEIAGLCREVADRDAGLFLDVVRLAVPPRHARVEKEPPRLGPPRPVAVPEPGAWTGYANGAAFVTALAEGRAPRAVWWALPG